LPAGPEALGDLMIGVRPPFLVTSVVTSGAIAGATVRAIHRISRTLAGEHVLQ
jgi:hypothetical protein